MKGYIKRTDGIIVQYECKVCGLKLTQYFYTGKKLKAALKEHRNLHKLKYTNLNNLKSWSI